MKLALPIFGSSSFYFRLGGCAAECTGARKMERDIRCDSGRVAWRMHDAFIFIFDGTQPARELSAAGCR
jgi:hypothetical protein